MYKKETQTKHSKPYRKSNHETSNPIRTYNNNKFQKKSDEMNHETKSRSNDDRKQNTEILGRISTTMREISESNIDTEKFLYVFTYSDKKKEVGNMVIDLRISLKENPDKYKCLVYVINRDVRTGLNHVFVMDCDNEEHKTLFTVSDRYPVSKLERYLPSIIKSTQNMIDVK